MSDEGKVRIEMVPLGTLRKWERNPKAHVGETIERSIARFGFVSPIVLDERSGKIAAGHGRAEALERMKAAGQDPPKRVEKAPDGEWLVPVVRGVAFNSDDEMAGFAVADNALAIKGGWDDAALAEVLAPLRDADLLDGIGYEPADVDNLIRRVGDAAIGEEELPPDEFPEPDEETSHKCPRCSYVWKGKAK